MVASLGREFLIISLKTLHLGNKRIAFLAMYIFLGLNGRRIVAEEPAVVNLMKAVAASDCSEPELADWLRAHTERR